MLSQLVSHLWPGVLVAAVYGLIGIGLLLLGYWLFDKMTPRVNVQKGTVREERGRGHRRRHAPAGHRLRRRARRRVTWAASGRGSRSRGNAGEPPHQADRTGAHLVLAGAVRLFGAGRSGGGGRTRICSTRPPARRTTHGIPLRAGPSITAVITALPVRSRAAARSPHIPAARPFHIPAARSRRVRRHRTRSRLMRRRRPKAARQILPRPCRLHCEP